MAAAAAKTGQTSRPDIENKFREEFGRDLTLEEKRLLGWAEKMVSDTPPEPSKEQKRKAS